MLKFKPCHFFPVLMIALPTVLPAQEFLSRDAEGWTILTPASDSRIIYVSSSDGNDETAATYSPGDPEIGEDPLMPVGEIQPYATISAAYEVSRDEEPDWILLKRGDTWYESLALRNGRSETEPSVVGSYGPGTERPLLKTGSSGGFNKCCDAYHYIVVTGIYFYAHTRNAQSGEYVSPEGSSGFNFYVNEGEAGDKVLVEDCLFRYYSGNVVQGPGTITNIIIRRNLILDNYSANSHSQGMYTKNIQSMLLEENVFDHNGWQIQSINSDNSQDSGQATIFNHNTYFSDGHNITFRNNIFLRASSIGNKWTANAGEASTSNIRIENNLYLEGELGISMGGNQTEPPHRFRDITMVNNVMVNIGRGRPTNRSLAWYLEINDWDTGTVSGNLFLHQNNPDVNNAYAIRMEGETRDVTVSDNIIYGIQSNGTLIRLTAGATKENITFESNAIQTPGSDTRLVQAGDDLDNYNFTGNTYFSDRSEDEWFQVGDARMGLNDWVTQSGETGASSEQVIYSDPDRTLESYHASLGGEATLEAFIAEIRQQSKLNWRPEYTASVINNWFRAGFDRDDLPVGDPQLSLNPGLKEGWYRAYSLDGVFMGMRYWTANPKSQSQIQMLCPMDQATGNCYMGVE